MDGVKEIPLSAEARLEIASLVYGKWCEAFDAKKAVAGETWVSAGKFCPRDEWPMYHEARVKKALADFEKWTRLREEVCKHSPLMEVVFKGA